MRKVSDWKNYHPFKLSNKKLLPCQSAMLLIFSIVSNIYSKKLISLSTTE